MPTTAEKAIAFIERLKHPEKTEWAGKPIILLEWQKSYLRDLLAEDSNGKRIKRKAIMFVPKKNGKTTLLAALAVYFLFAERGGQIFLGSNDIEQASILYRMASSIIEQDPWLSDRKRCRVYRNPKKIQCYYSGSDLIVGSSEAVTKNGLNVSVGIFDECGFFESSELMDAIESSQITRSEPLILGISTAGSDTNSHGFRLFETCRKWVAEPEKYPDCLGIIYQGDAKRWDDPDEWYRCNPSLRELGSIAFIRQQIQAVKDEPSQLRRVLRYHLNVWVGADGVEPWIALAKWDACDEMVSEEELALVPCYLGIDVATRCDMSAVCALFFLPDRRYAVRMWYFTPADTLDRREHSDKAPYSVWRTQGHLKAVPGDYMDTSPLLELAKELRSHYDVREVGIDPAHNATDLTSSLQSEGFNVVWVQQGWRTVVPATREIEALVNARRLVHFGNPVLRWNVQNTRLKMVDDAGNMMPSKKTSNGRVDGVFAMIDAIAREMANRSKGAPSISF